jgi:hypothetical protein
MFGMSKQIAPSTSITMPVLALTAVATVHIGKTYGVHSQLFFNILLGVGQEIGRKRERIESCVFCAVRADDYARNNGYSNKATVFYARSVPKCCKQDN